MSTNPQVFPLTAVMARLMLMGCVMMATLPVVMAVPPHAGMKVWSLCNREPGLHIHIPCLGMCGDEKVGASEQCDNGNAASGDGCSPTCTNEGLNPHEAGIPRFTTTTKNSVAPPHCGDGTVDADEECDDGSTTGGDGCSSVCQNEGMATTMRCRHNSECHFHFHCICIQAPVVLVQLVLVRSVMMVTLTVVIGAPQLASMKV